MQKIVKLNRALLYCCMVVLFCLHFTGYAAPRQGKPVSITIKNSSLAEVLRQVSKKSGLYIYFQDADLAAHKSVTIDVKNKPVENVLHELLDGRGFSWVEVSENTIAVKKKPEIEEKKVEMDTVSTITVTGKVVDEKGEPVIGATVAVKGSKMGTTTNSNGDFVLKGINSNSGLIISNISFLTIELAISGRKSLGNIKLKEYVGELDETVVVAYGTATRRTSTSTIGIVKADEIEKQPVNDPLLALQGRIPGVIVNQTNGNFGAKVNVQIRGQNSLNFQSNPLFIVDDVPIDNDNFSLNNTITGGNLSPFSFLNPGDIESISVLKDADATAIYGSRGANGIVLITTKKGKVGKPKLALNTQLGYGHVPKKIDLLDTDQYIQMRKEAYRNDGLDYTAGIITGPNSDLRLFSQSKYTDWQKVMIGGTAQYQDYQASLSGGANTIQYLVGGNLHRESTVYPGDNKNNKSNLHFSITGNSTNNRFRINFSGSYLFDNMNTGQYDYTSNIFLAPNAPDLNNSDGSINWAINPATGVTTWLYKGNPYANNLVRNKSKIYNLLSSLNLAYDLREGLKIKLVGGYNRLTGSNVNIIPAMSFEPAARNDVSIVNNLRISTFSNNIAESWSFEPQLNYKLNLRNSSLEVLVGSSLQKNANYSDNLSLSGFSSDALLLNRAAATIVNGKDNATAEYKYSAVFARVTYNLHNRYLVNVNLRRDGSSRFGPGNQFGNFGSAAAAWIFSEENFFRKKFSLISYGKLKFSYGSTGNDGIGNYSYLESYRLSQSTVTYQGDLGYTSNGAVNTSYHWEAVKKMELGLELGIFKDRILFQGNYFRNRSTSQLINYPIPTFAGYGSVYTNLPAKLQNSGIELVLNTQNIKLTKFGWSSTLSFTRNRNKLLEYPSIDQSAYYLTQIGSPFFGYVNVYKFGGVNQTTGLYQFYDNKGNLTSTPTNSGPPYYGRDSRIITYPDFYGGLLNSLSFEGFSLDVFCQFTKQNGINPLYQSTASSSPPGSSRLNVLKKVFDNRWTSENPLSEIRRVTTSQSALSTQQNNVRNSDAGYTDASFIRLKNVSLSYSIPSNSLKSFKIQACRLYVQGQNILTFTKYDGLDPETQSLTTLPPLRTIVFGVQIIL